VTSKDLGCLSNSVLLVLSVLFGVIALYMHNNLLPYFYLIYAVCVIISEKGYFDVDNDLMAAAWLLLAMLPIPFLLYYQDILLSALCVLFFWGWFFVRSRFDHGDHAEWCLMRKGRK